MHINDYKKKEIMNVSKQVEIYTYCSVNKQYEEGIQKWKKVYLML